MDKSRSQELRREAMESVAKRAERDALDTRYDWLRTRTRRKTLVMTTFAVLTLYGLSMFFDWVFVTLPALIAYGACLWLLRISVRGATNYPDEVVDERVRHVRGYTYRYAYMGSIVLMSLYLVFYIGNALMVKADWVSPLTAENMHDAAFVLMFSLIALPSAIFAWMEPALDDLA